MKFMSLIGQKLRFVQQMAQIFQIFKRVDVGLFIGLKVKRKLVYFASNLPWKFLILRLFKVMAFSQFLNVLMENSSGGDSNTEKLPFQEKTRLIEQVEDP